MAMAVNDGRTFLSTDPLVQEGDEVVIYVKYGVVHSLKVSSGQTLQMQFGALRHDFLVGKPYGSRISTTRGYVYVLRPTPELWTQTLPHRTQIIYTPDISLILMLMDVEPGSVVLEAGTGSGALSHALARTLYPSGHLLTFDIEESRVEAGRRELGDHGFGDVVTSQLRNVCSDGFGVEDHADAVFLDLPSPWEAVHWVRLALKKSGGRFCSFSPCIEQVKRTAEALQSFGFVFLETVECVPRQLRVLEPQMDTLTVREDEYQPSTKKIRPDEQLSDEQKKMREDQQKLHPTVIPFPAKQPVHTGYLTSATLPPQI